ncbi:hypothetical protein PR048_004684 [Dryococelus australis]|uniref:Uncharacterized protein n=1 Tax=Dryococelus australis TaxID=614101 RepID=A0ABQ9I770_9NEOP|nr:hypothetical protein PR048_004684 [Dryococelus australis]
MIRPSRSFKHVFEEFANQKLRQLFLFCMTMQNHIPVTTPLARLQKLSGKFCPDLAPSDFCLFGQLKEAHSGHNFEDVETLKHSVCQLLRKQDHDFYCTGIHALVSRWAKTIDWSLF